MKSGKQLPLLRYETVGNLNISMSNFEGEITVIRDYKETVTVAPYNEENPEYSTAEVTVLKNSYMRQVQGFSDIKIYFTYEGKTYEYTLSESYPDGTLTSDETIIDDEYLLALADAVNTFLSADVNAAIFKTNGVKALFGQDITLSENVVINIKNYDMDIIDPVKAFITKNAEYLLSMKDYIVLSGINSYSSKGLLVTNDVDTTGMSEENPDPSRMYSYMALHGPVTVDGKEYYFDYTIDGITEQMEGGIRVDGVWKALSMGY